MGSRMPTDKCASHSAFHFWANSVSSSRSGMKLPANAVLRPAVFVPTMELPKGYLQRRAVLLYSTAVCARSRPVPANIRVSPFQHARPELFLSKAERLCGNLPVPYPLPPLVLVSFLYIILFDVGMQLFPLTPGRKTGTSAEKVVYWLPGTGPLCEKELVCNVQTGNTLPHL